MNQAEHISQEDLTLLALQFLPEKEMPEVLAHVAQCDQCKQELALIQGDLAVYALTASMHSPPAYARERLLRQINKEKRIVHGRRSGSVPIASAGGTADDFSYNLPIAARSRVLNFWSFSGWAVAAGLAVVSAIQYSEHQHQASDYQSQLAQMETRTGRAQDVLETLTDSRAKQVGIHVSTDTTKRVPEAHAAYMADTGSLVFFASNLQPLQAYKTYELWLLPATGHDPIAVGLFKPDGNGNANVLMPNLPKGVPASGFGITIEDEGGAKQPTLPIVMSGS